MLKEKHAQELFREVRRLRAKEKPGTKRAQTSASPIRITSGVVGYDQGCAKVSPRGFGRMTAKAEIPPVNGNEMKVLGRTAKSTNWQADPERELLLCSWSNLPSVL